MTKSENEQVENEQVENEQAPAMQVNGTNMLLALNAMRRISFVGITDQEKAKRRKVGKAQRKARRANR